MESSVQKAIQVVRGGGIIIFPTDTAFGVGCRLDDTEAVDRLFAIRNRPRDKATPVLVSSKEMALAYLDHPSDIVRRMMQAYWPGGLTIVSPCRTDLVYSPIRGNGNTVGLRMPNHPDILTIIEAVGAPVLGPSANFHKDKTPYRFEDLNQEFIKLVDYVLPGVCSIKQASTVVDCSEDPYRIIRQGAVQIPSNI
jgi:L-threonylcarbamoyladenylate synthase